MVTEEIGLNPALEAAGVEVVETDLGEYIVQLAGERPFHILKPAIHLPLDRIRALFSAAAGRDVGADAHAMTALRARQCCARSSWPPTWASRAPTSAWRRPARSCW